MPSLLPPALLSLLSSVGGGCAPIGLSKVVNGHMFSRTEFTSCSPPTSVGPADAQASSSAELESRGEEGRGIF